MTSCGVKDARLSHAAFVEEIELANGRLRYKLISGSGPETGWVSTRLYGKDLLRRFLKVRDAAAPEKQQWREVPFVGRIPMAATPQKGKQPLFCAWYSGGFSMKDGEKLLAPLMEAVKDAGVEDAAIFHFPDGYEMTGEGREPWATYIDLLVGEINKAAGAADRPLILFGHSRGAAPATCVAYRLGTRVKKVYIVACGAMKAQEPTGWELLSQRFKEGGDRDLLKWFSSIQPDNLLLRRTAFEASLREFEEQITSSKMMSDMLHVMRTQYRDAMFPDPDRDFGCMPVPIMAVSPLQDEACQPDHCEAWGRLTSAGFQLETVEAGHMDCLMPRQEEIPIPSEVRAESPLLPPDPRLTYLAKQWFKVRELQHSRGRCELFEKICKDMQQNSRVPKVCDGWPSLLQR
eukprot:s4056_g5.t1